MEIFKKAGIRIATTDKPDTGVLFLKNGKFDVIVEDRLVVQEAIDRLLPGESEHFVFQEKPYSSGIFYRLMVSKSFPRAAELLLSFNKGLSSIMANGTYSRIMEKFEKWH